MVAVKKTISISENVLKDAAAIAPNFSAVVESALVEYIKHYRIKKAIDSFGKWSERGEASVDIVNSLRKEDDRDVVKRNDSAFDNPNTSSEG